MYEELPQMFIPKPIADEICILLSVLKTELNSKLDSPNLLSLANHISDEYPDVIEKFPELDFLWFMAGGKRENNKKDS